MVFPRWSTSGFGQQDTAWRTGAQQIMSQANACWLEMPVLFFQQSSIAPIIGSGKSTPSLASFTSGIHYAHSLGLRVFVTPLLQINQTSQPWAGALRYTTLAQEQAWFHAYWLAIKPYLVAAQQAGVEQFALGTEEAWLENHAPSSLWKTLITQARTVFSGVLTYDRNWDSLAGPLPVWMQSPELAMIGVSAYFPVEETPTRVAPEKIPALWARVVLPQLDAFARRLGKPIFLSETGYRATTDALYLSWETTSHAPPDPQEQAGAISAELTNVLPDPRIRGVFFWGWSDVGQMSLAGQPAVNIIQTAYGNAN